MPVATHTIALTVNGTRYERAVEPRLLLVHLLRDVLGLTGTHIGCETSICGACTVAIDGDAVKSCTVLAVQADGAEITTIEGVARAEELHPLQTAFIEHDGFQCGYCTAGQIMSGIACMAEGHAHTPEEIRFWMSGNICRCGAYPGIVAAIGKAANGS
jgi:xanthine dehydrogenase YagT iron-sulfur-binding subunit